MFTKVSPKLVCFFLVIIFTADLFFINPLNANPEKWSNTLKQIVCNLPTICLSVFDHFMNLALKGLTTIQLRWWYVKLYTSISRSEEKPLLIHNAHIEYSFFKEQKQPSRRVLRKRCFENMQQIYRRTTMPKCELNNVALQLYLNHTSAWVFSCKFAA